MRAGQLRTPIVLQQRTSGQDGAGQPVDAWTDLVTLWADVRTVGGLEAIKADAVAATTKASARIRWRADVYAAMRVLIDGQPWQITAVLPDINHRRHVDLALERVE